MDLPCVSACFWVLSCGWTRAKKKSHLLCGCFASNGLPVCLFCNLSIHVKLVFVKMVDSLFVLFSLFFLVLSNFSCFEFFFVVVVLQFVC